MMHRYARNAGNVVAVLLVLVAVVVAWLR